MNADRPDDRAMMEIALGEARASLEAGGVPVGAALADGGRLVASGHNERVQLGDPIAHGEMSCLRNAGRQSSYRGMTMYTTLSPCPMCTGAILLFQIPRVVVGEATTSPATWTSWPATAWTCCCSTMSAVPPLCRNSRNAIRRSGARTSAGGPVAAEADRGRVRAADHHRDALARCRRVAPGHQRRQRRAPARLGHQPEPVPEQFLGRGDGVVADQHHLGRVPGEDRESQLAYPPRRRASRPPRCRPGRPPAAPPAARRSGSAPPRVRRPPPGPGPRTRRRSPRAARRRRRWPARGRPPGPAAASSRSESARAEDGFGLIVGVDRQGTPPAAHSWLAASASA